MNKKPKLTIISPSLNTGKFLRDTIDSILNQSYKNFEHIVIDGESTDETLKILKEYSHIRWISEKDNGYLDAFRKGLAMARGDYIMQCCISDGYLDKDWFKKCVDTLDNNQEVSLVWGLPQDMTEDGQLGEICHPLQFRKSTPPQKTEFVYYWLSTYQYFFEGNFCIRKNVVEEYLPLYKNPGLSAWLEFIYKFNRLGYLPYFIPTVANFGRFHKNQVGLRNTEDGFADLKSKNYQKKVKKYRQELILGKVTHKYKNGRGELLPYKFFMSKLITSRIFFSPTSLKILVKSFANPILKKSPKLYKVGKKIFRIFYK